MGRTLDYEFSYGDQITVTPRNYPFSFLHLPSLSHHYAMIGMACVMDDYPLYYDAFNEKGLGIAGLNFVGNAVYFDPKPEKDNIAQFELIPWILTEQLPASVTETAGQPVFQPARSFYVQPWHGRSWTAGRPLVCFPLCTRGVCKAELDLGKQRNGECQPVFPYFKFC